IDPITAVNNFLLNNPNEIIDQELSLEAREKLIKEILEQQEGLKALIQRVESVKGDHDQKQSGNQILQTYINNLMSSSVLSSVNGKKDI
ncbi:8286_t:CDS:2, partial [Diversispora eburnea]